MEGMISKKIANIQQRYVDFGGGTTTAEEWAKFLVIKLLETTHGQ